MVDNRPADEFVNIPHDIAVCHEGRLEGLFAAGSTAGTELGQNVPGGFYGTKKILKKNKKYKTSD